MCVHVVARATGFYSLSEAIYTGVFLGEAALPLPKQQQKQLGSGTQRSSMDSAGGTLLPSKLLPQAHRTERREERMLR